MGTGQPGALSWHCYRCMRQVPWGWLCPNCHRSWLTGVHGMVGTVVTPEEAAVHEQAIADTLARSEPAGLD